MSLWDKDALRRKLMSAAEQEAFLRTYGEAVRPILEAALDERVKELAACHEASWGKFFAHMQPEVDAVLISREKAAEMLDVSLSTIQRLEKRGDLPEPKKFGLRTVRHRLQDVLAFAKRSGIAVRHEGTDQIAAAPAFRRRPRG